MDSEFILRFMWMEAKDSKQDPASDWFLSEDRVLGMLKNFDASRFISFGRFKLKGKHQKQVIRFMGDLFFNAELLYRAMHVLRRRKRFELGLYSMSNGGEVFAILEGDNCILIAPAIFDEPKLARLFEDFVVRTNKALFEKWKTWARILHGRR